ncbi:MAG: HAD family phosphatase [Erysipelotrichaceae bacterium]|nr:HAD family phosphatase [Erysipelotrichaceae bacterium]
MIKLIVTDLDGTFIMPSKVDGKIVSKENTEALHRFIAQGGRFATASGRHHEFSYQLMDELGFKFDAIGINSATIVKDDCLIEHNHPARHIVRIVAQELTKPEYQEHLEVIATDLSQTFILGNPNSWIREKMENGNPDHDRKISDISLVDWLNDRTKPDPTSLHVNIKDPARLHDWITFLREKFDRYFDIYASGSVNIEFMRPGINKGHGVRSLMEMYGLDEHEVAVCGDNQNDISMFFAAKYSYCMSSATPQVKKYATKVVDSVAEAIEDILQKNELERASRQL